MGRSGPTASEATRKARFQERLAKGVIRCFALLTVCVLVWIIGYILYKGFYTDRSVPRKVIADPRTVVRVGGEESSETVFIVHRGVRTECVQVYDLLTLFSKPRNENWGFYTGQDIKARPFAYRDAGDPFTAETREFLTGGGQGFPDYVNFVTSPAEMIERVARTPGGLGYLPASWGKAAMEDNRIRILGVEMTAVAVNESVTEMEENRILREITSSDLERIFSGRVANWSELGGRDIPVVPIRVDAKAPGNEAEAAGSAGIAIEEAITLLRSVEGAVAMIPYPEAVRQGLPLLDILRRERGPNLTLRFLVEAPARSGQWGGISSIIVNTLFLILFTLLLSVPVGIGAGIFLVEYARQEKVVSVLRMGTETLAGIPSIVFGLFGNVFFVRVLGFGIGFVSSTLTVTLMILPTIVRTTEEALKAVPMTFREGSLAIGATRLQTLFRVVLPAASPGILTGIILAVGRTVGETAVLLYTLGSSYELVRGPSSSARVLSLHLYLLFSEAISFERAFATAAVLVLIVLAVNLMTTRLVGRMNRLAGQ